MCGAKASKARSRASFLGFFFFFLSIRVSVCVGACSVCICVCSELLYACSLGVCVRVCARGRACVSDGKEQRKMPKLFPAAFSCRRRPDVS